MKVKEATGAVIRKQNLEKQTVYYVTDFGAKSHGDPVKNTEAINQAIEAAYHAGGGCVVFPEGEYKTYTIVLKSHVNIKIEKNAVIKAARTDIKHAYETQVGEGGNYLEPEINLYAGLQDHGHSYFANSLFYAKEEENIMIYGEGLIDGSYLEEETGYLRYTLMGGDPIDQPERNKNGHVGEWFGNKAIALVRCKHVVLADFSLVIGGHFAIIAEGVEDFYVEKILVDTTRDAFDLDCCQDVTVVHSVFNSLTDDALVVKASYGAGIFMPAKNILIEDCTVSGFDAGSVYAGVYSCDKLIATDSCGPTGRVKLGTESTCGYERVTVRRVHFQRSRGFALEAVDGSDLKDILFEDATMDTISSSPIFICVGDRARFPVTGNSTDEKLVADEDNVRLDNRNWVLPNTQSYQYYSIKRYCPSYNKDQEVCIDGKHRFSIINQTSPARVNETNLIGKDFYSEREKFKYANAIGVDHIAQISNIIIRNIKITNADPRYPILIMGLVDSKVESVELSNISVCYRGGLSMEHAVEQRQLFTNWAYKQYLTKESIQTLPWLVNPFFAKGEALLPRVDWEEGTQSWAADPYNVPELPQAYPEPSNWGILPAYGLYIRHARNITLSNIEIMTMIEDQRDVIVLDDVEQLYGYDVSVMNQAAKKVTVVQNHFKRHTNQEYLLEEPYFTTSVVRASFEAKDKPEHDTLTTAHMRKIDIYAPAPGTPKDSQYGYETVACEQTGYHYETGVEDYPLPLTVYRPFLAAVPRIVLKKGEKTVCNLVVRDPASQTSKKESDSFIYNEAVNDKKYVVSGQKRVLRMELAEPVQGVMLDTAKKTLFIDTKDCQAGVYTICIHLSDDVLVEKSTIVMEILA